MLTIIVSSDYDTISMLCIITFTLGFPQIIKICCLVHMHAMLFLKKISIRIFKKEAILCYFKDMSYEKQLGSLKEISHSPKCCWYVKSLLFLFCVYLIKGDNALTEISPFKTKWNGQKSI